MFGLFKNSPEYTVLPTFPDSLLWFVLAYSWHIMWPFVVSATVGLAVGMYFNSFFLGVVLVPPVVLVPLLWWTHYAPLSNGA